MDAAINDAVAIDVPRSIPETVGGLRIGAQASNGGASRPNSIAVSSSIYPKLSTTVDDSTDFGSTADTSITSQRTNVPPSSSSAIAVSTTTTPSMRNNTKTSSTRANPSITGITVSSTTTAQSTDTAASTSSPTPSTPSPTPSTPSDLDYSVGVLQPKKSEPTSLCPPPFLLIRGFCLHLSDTRQGAEESRRLCRRIGGRLAAFSDEEAQLLTRLTWPPPPPPRRGQYAWVDGAVGQPARQKRTLVGRRLCTAATASTGRLVLRHCEEPHRSLCERRPLRTDPRRQRRSATQLEELAADQTCHCKEGYGGADCSVTAQSSEGHEFVYCRDTTIGSKNHQIVVDFGVMGRLPWETKITPSNCPDPEVPLPVDTNGCIVPSSEAILRYWCQGKEMCTPSIDSLTAFAPEACTFEDSYNVSMWLYLRYRDDSQSHSVAQCLEGGTYDRETLTCYAVTSSPGYFHDQRGRCRDLGGDIAYRLSSSEYSGYVNFLHNLVSSAGHTVDQIWMAGDADEPRPVVDMADDQTAPFPCLSLETGDPMDCEAAQRLFAVCALPPWPGEAAPNCPPVRFDEYGLVFPETAAGQTVSLPCGDGYSGTASYTCGLDGQWSSQYPDLSACHSEDINTDDAKARLDAGTEPVSGIVSELATNVTKRTSQSQPLTSGDVISSVQLLPQMVQVQQAQLSGQQQQDQQRVATEYLGNVTSLVSGLTQGEASWHAMPQTERSDTSTVLQTNVEQSAYLLADYLDNRGQDFNYQTIRLRTGRYGSLEGNLEYTTQQGSTVMLPDEVGKFNRSGKTSIVFVEYGNMDCLLSGQKCRTPKELHDQPDLQYDSFVNSPLVSASVGNTSVTLTGSNVTLTFKTRLSAGQFNLTNYQCAYWDVQAEMWSFDGCYLGRTTNESVECLCNHLTSFATLMDINGVIEEGSVLDLALSWLTTIGCVISLLSLAACLLVFTGIPSLRSERTSVHRNLCFCLFTAELILLVGLQPHGNATGCAIVAGLLHFFFLAAFAWMCIEGVQIYLMVYKVFATRKSYLRYFYVCGYGIPALIVIISLSVTKGEGYGSETACWLSTENGLIWAFAGPLLLVVLVNILALAMALRVTARATKGRSTKAPPQASTWIRGSASLVAILGTTWLFGFLYFSNGLLFFSVVFTILNSLQGFFIFLFHVWLNDKNRTEARRFMWKTTNRMGLTEHDLTSTSVGVTSRAHGGHTVETSVVGPAPDVPGSPRSDTASTGANGQPHKANGPSNLIMRALKRVNGDHYSVKRINGEAMDSTSASHETLRKMESSRPMQVDA